MIATQLVAALGTLRDGAPFVSLVPFVAVLDVGAPVSFYIHISRLAQHTPDILADPRVGLMIAETDGGAGDPQRLARVYIEGVAAEMAPQDSGYGPTRERYLARFPDLKFNLADFSSFASCRAAGFGRIFDLSAAELVDPDAASRRDMEQPVI